GTARSWDRATGKQLALFKGHQGYVKCAALSADGKQVLTGGTDGTVRLWDAVSGKELRVFRKHEEPLVAVAFLAGGRQTLSGSRDAAVHLWKLAKPVAVKPPAPSGPVKGVPRPAAVVRVGGVVGSLLLAPDGKALYFLNLTDGVVGRVETAS